MLAACGEPLVGADYQGEPLMVLSGQVLMEDALPVPQGEVRVAVFWSSQGEHGHQHQQQTQVSTSFPSRYTLTLFTPPPDEVLYQPPHTPSPVAIGLPMLYDDADFSGSFDGGEEVLGGSLDVLVFYSAESLGHQPPPADDTDDPQGEGPREAIEPGFHAVQQLGQSCDQGDLVLTQVDPTTVAMAVGDLWTRPGDMDCDGDDDEWGEL
jgi:hypothetical protein